MNLGSSDHSLQVTFFIYPTFNLSVELGTCEVKHGSNKECKTLVRIIRNSSCTVATKKNNQREQAMLVSKGVDDPLMTINELYTFMNARSLDNLHPAFHTNTHTHTLFDLHTHPAPAPSTFHMHPAFAPCRLHVCTFQLHPMPSTCNVHPSHVPRTRTLDYTMVPPCNCTCTMPMPLLHPTHALPHRTHALPHRTPYPGGAPNKQDVPNTATPPFFNRILHILNIILQVS